MNDRDCQRFDYDEIDRRVDGHCPADDAPEDRACSRAELAAALAELPRWIIYGSGRDALGRHSYFDPAPPAGDASPAGMLAWLVRGDLIAKRAIAAAWLLDPSLFGGMSLSAVGALPSVKASRRALCHHAADFEATFGIRSRGQRTQTNRDALSESAAKRWQRERAKQKIEAAAPKAIGAN